MATLSTPERIGFLAHDLGRTLTDSIEKIQELNDRTHVLAINARIEAARAGVAGRGFRVVADAFGRLNVEIQEISTRLTEESTRRLEDLLAISGELAGNVRGQRLTQWAGSVMDIVDRNLYERTCDVRWWATEAAVVQALSKGAAMDDATERLGTILDSYTVYADIVLAAPDGTVVANGRPGLFPIVGLNVRQEPWFSQALRLSSSQEFGFQSAHRGALGGGEPVLVYSAPVCDRGRCQDVPLGVLGVVFRWEGLGRTLLEKTASDLDSPAELLLADPTGRVLARPGSGDFGEMLEWQGVGELMVSTRSGFRIVQDDGRAVLLARGVSPGFETYATGWSCFIRQWL